MLAWLIVLGVGLAMVVLPAALAGKHAPNTPERHRARYVVPAALGFVVTLIAVLGLASLAFESIIVAVT